VARKIYIFFNSFYSAYILIEVLTIEVFGQMAHVIGQLAHVVSF